MPLDTVHLHNSAATAATQFSTYALTYHNIAKQFYHSIHSIPRTQAT
jgi:hypothetical protein